MADGSQGPWPTAFMLTVPQCGIYWSTSEAWTTGGELPRLYISEHHAEQAAAHHVKKLSAAQQGYALKVIPITLSIPRPRLPWWSAVADFLKHAGA